MYFVIFIHFGMVYSLKHGGVVGHMRVEKEINNTHKHIISQSNGSNIAIFVPSIQDWYQNFLHINDRYIYIYIFFVTYILFNNFINE